MIVLCCYIFIAFILCSMFFISLLTFISFAYVGILYTYYRALTKHIKVPAWGKNSAPLTYEGVNDYINLGKHIYKNPQKSYV